MEDVEVGGVARPQHAVGEDVRVRAAPLARDRVDALDVLGAELEQPLADERDAFVLANARLQRLEEILVRRVDHRARHVQQRDLVGGLHHARVLHQRLPVDDRDPGRLERAQDGQLDDVDAERLAEQAALLELGADLLGDRLGPARDRPAQGRDAGARAVFAEPRVEELVMPGG